MTATRGAAAAATVAVTALALAELGASKLVQVPGRQTFAQELWAQMHYAATATTAALGLVQLTLALVVWSLIATAWRRRSPVATSRPLVTRRATGYASSIRPPFGPDHVHCRPLPRRVPRVCARATSRPARCSRAASPTTCATWSRSRSTSTARRGPTSGTWTATSSIDYWSGHGAMLLGHSPPGRGRGGAAPGGEGHPRRRLPRAGGRVGPAGCSGSSRRPSGCASRLAAPRRR